MTIRRILQTTLLTASLLAPTRLYAESVADCYERVTELCADAMDGARWYERFAVGVLCTGMLAGCAAETF